MSAVNRFVISFLVFTLVVAVAPALVYYTGHGNVLVNKFGVMFFFFSALTFMVCIAVIITNQKSQAMAAQVFLIGTTVKILLCLGFALAYLHKNHVNHVYFLGCFFYLYLLNTVFEVYSLLSNLRNSNFK
ncbi:hypothetical protein BDD43_1819 [Mucilaginibacter gracilis]|uniref:ATP synthase protein I n=1 Tax=Mucilaginibacter gracilis TaxID=423350 RepID=A0A495J0P5_9SPHI|nr:hypothetical protein [Mucilaginibacter gracilis]RKR81669.1 hypothetical protein BDD43_1819 [Mucilaginibacter gracilis]